MPTIVSPAMAISTCRGWSQSSPGRSARPPLTSNVVAGGTPWSSIEPSLSTVMPLSRAAAGLEAPSRAAQRIVAFDQFDRQVEKDFTVGRLERRQKARAHFLQPAISFDDNLAAAIGQIDSSHAPIFRRHGAQDVSIVDQTIDHV